MCNCKCKGSCKPKGEEFQKAKDKRDAEMFKACARCTVSWNDCPANETCPHLLELMKEN